jgi:hypothetical protein
LEYKIAENSPNFMENMQFLKFQQNSISVNTKRTTLRHMQIKSRNKENNSENNKCL